MPSTAPSSDIPVGIVQPLNAPSETADGVVVQNPHEEALAALLVRLKAGAVVESNYERLLVVNYPLHATPWGAAYHVSDAATKLPFALHVVPAKSGGAAAAHAGAMVLSRLSHQNIVQCHECFVQRFSNQPFVCVRLELCPGGSLAQYIQRKQSRNAAFPPSVIFAYLLQLTSALAYLHREGILHGDLRPHTILRSADRSLKLADFGQPTMLQRRPCVLLTITGGSRTYVPPECSSSVSLRRSLLPSEVPAPAYDMWGLGCILGELATATLLAEDRLPDGRALAMDPVQLRLLREEMEDVHEGSFLSLFDDLLHSNPSQRSQAAQLHRLLKTQSRTALHTAVASGLPGISPRRPQPGNTIKTPPITPPLPLLPPLPLSLGPSR